MPERVDIHTIEAILFDMNGTLRMRVPHPETQQAAFSRLSQLLGNQTSDESYWEELTRRQKAYSCWAQQNLAQLTEAEIWAQWICPDLPRKQIEPAAAELMLAWGERKGRVIPNPGAGETIRTLKKRGYRLGVISNSSSTLDIPRSLELFGWKEYFDVVVLSSEIKIRKPAPEPFLEAARRLDLLPARCAYLGNRIMKDIAGCQHAGFGLGIALEQDNGPYADELVLAIKPDLTLHSLAGLLEIFPDRKGLSNGVPSGK
jgi:putative hydrolase of the HAD superfamily